MRETRVQSLGWEDPLEKAMADRKSTRLNSSHHAGYLLLCLLGGLRFFLLLCHLGEMENHPGDREGYLRRFPAADFPGGSDGKVSAYNAGDPGSIPGLGRSSGEGNGTPLQYSCLESPMDGGAWWAAVHGVAESQTQLK